MLTKDSTIEAVRDTADHLYQLLDLIFVNFRTAGIAQTESLIGLSLELSTKISSWADAEEKRRNG